MRIYKIFFFSVLLLEMACKGDKTPNGVIKPPQMAGLLTEVHMIDGSLYSLQPLPDTLYKYGTGKYLTVFKKYHTDSTQFRKSFKYYSTQPAILLTIYEQVSLNLKRKTDSLNKLQSKTNALPKK